jgi:hypothetical protein
MALVVRGGYHEDKFRRGSAAMGDLWTYRNYEWGSSTTDIVGYAVRAVDGDIGNVTEATDEVGASYIVVTCGP